MRKGKTIDTRILRSCALVTTSMTPSSRIKLTDDPCIVAMQSMLKQAPSDTMSLSQGIVFWTPPAAALQRATNAINLPHTSQYCNDAGIPQLRNALLHKLTTENNLSNTTSIMVTVSFFY